MFLKILKNLKQIIEKKKKKVARAIPNQPGVG
jgi:hypothetical protein